MEDQGEAISFHVYVYDVQPGVEIDYATGGSQAASEADSTENGTDTRDPASKTYILNTNTRRFHLPSCSGVSSMKDSNKETYRGSRDTLLAEGYTPCGICSP